MNSVDPFDGEKIRGGQKLTNQPRLDFKDDNLLTIRPIVDGRLKDEGR
jgi:hypothetical protein